MSDLRSLQDLLGYSFRDEQLLILALTHPSVAHEQGGAIEHNQRLEFLGDAVLQLVLTSELYEGFPGFGEGPLTKARAQMVNRRALAERSRRLGLGAHLRLSRGEEVNGGRHRASALADAFEAVLGAIFLDGGLDSARAVILKLFAAELSEVEGLPNLDNPKGELQEILQARSSEAPQYQLKSVSGPDHDRLFECAVYHRGVELGTGKGKSKKEAESRAALMALQDARSQAAPSA